MDKNHIIRKCKKRLEEIKHTKPKPETQKDKDNKKHILDIANKAIAERKHNTLIDTQSRAYEAAGDLLNLNRGRLIFQGGFGEGKMLGAGRWVRKNGEWIKKE